MLILKVTKNQSFTLSLDSIFFGNIFLRLRCGKFFLVEIQY